MNKRRKAQIFSLMLAFLMLASVIPGTFLKPVSAAIQVQIQNIETNYGDSVVFAGYPFEVNFTVNASATTWIEVNITYTTPSGTQTVYSEIFQANSGLTGFNINSQTDFDAQFHNVPQDATDVAIIITRMRATINGFEYAEPLNETHFIVKRPFTVTLQNIESDVPYYNGTAWVNDEIFEYIPFHVTINVTYDPQLVNNSLISVPSEQDVNITLPNGTVITETIQINGKTDSTLIQNNTGIKEIYIDGINANGSISVTSIGGSYTFTNLSAATVNGWWLEKSFQVVPQGANSTSPYKYVSFDLYVNVTATSVLGTLGVNDPVNVSVTSDVLGGWNTSTMTNGFAQVVVKGLKVDPATATVTLAHYPVNTSFTVTGTPWNIYISDYAVYYTNKTQNDTVFYVNVPAVLNVTVQYNLTVALNSTANYTILLNGEPIANDTFPVTNNVGTFEVPLTPDETGTITVIVEDPEYHVSTSKTISVKPWNVTGAYKVFHYGTYEDRQFYIGIPGNLYLNATFSLPILLNSSVAVKVYAPNGSVIYNGTMPITNNSGEMTIPNLVFEQTGDVLVKIYNTTFGIADNFTIPVKDWGIYVDSTPESLTVGESTPLTVEVRESLYFPGNEPVNVKLYLPDGTVLSENITLQGSSYTANGGYYGIVTFTDVNATLPGLAKIVVTDLTFGKTAVKYIPVYPNLEVTGRWIDVKVTPEKSPVYAYVDNALRIDAQYYYNAGEGAYPDKDARDPVNITIIDADGTVYELNNLEVSGGAITIPNYPLPVNGTGPIYVYVVDAWNSSIRGVAEIPVQNWQVTFDITPDFVYQYVDDIAKITVHVPAGVAIDVNVSGTVYTGVTDGQVISIPIVDPTEAIDVNVVATYHNAVSGKDYVVGSASKTIELKGWHVELDYTPKVIYAHIPSTLVVKAVAVDNETGKVLPFDIDLVLYNWTEFISPGAGIVATGTNTVSVLIEDDEGTGLMYYINATYGAHAMPISGEGIEYVDIPSFGRLYYFNVTTQAWNINITKTITSSAYSGTDYLWAGVPAQVTFTAVTYDADTGEQISLPISIPIKVTYNGYTYTGTDAITINLASPEPGNEAFHVEAAYEDISYFHDFVIPVKDWDIYINAYPSKLYADLPQQLTLIIGYSAGIESNATVDVGGTTYTAHVEPVGKDSAIAVVNVGEVVASEGYLRVTVTNQYGKTATLKIPVVSWDIAVTPKVNFVYTNVSTNITVDVHYSDSMLDGNANVHLVLPDGTELTKNVIILNGKGQVTFNGVVADRMGNIIIYAEDVASGKKSSNMTIEVHDWHMEVTLEPTEWYTYLPHDYTVGVTYIDDVTRGTADINATVEFSYNLTGVTGSEAVTITDGQGEVTFTGLATENAGVGTFTVKDADHGKSRTVNVTIHGWNVVVTYPEKLFVAPGYENPVAVDFVYIADDNSTVPYTGNTTITIELPGREPMNATVNASPVDFGMIELNQTGIGNITVVANDYPKVNFTGTIQVMNLLEMNLTTRRLYENVPTEIVANITYNGGDYHDLEVYIEGQNITLATTDGQIWTAEVALPAGNYTVVAYDTVHNVTITETFHVAPWHLEIVPNITSISAGDLAEVNFTVKAIDDETNDTADIDALIHINITFSNPALIPNGIFTVQNFILDHGQHNFSVNLFAPAPGNFTVKAIAINYGRCAKTVIQVTEPTAPPTYVYLQIYNQGNMTVPNDTVVLYWSVDGKTYFPAYDANAGRIAETNPAENNEMVLTVYPVKSFALYFIAVPKFIAERYPILTSEPIIDTVTTENVNYSYSVELVNGTIVADVTVHKKTITEGWTYRIPTAPGYVVIKPPVSVPSVAPYTGYQYVYKEELANDTGSVNYTFTFEPTEFMEFKKLTNLSIQPARYGSYFEFKARVYEKYLNMSDQFDEQFEVFKSNVENMVGSLQFLKDDDRQELINEIVNEALGYKDDIIGAYPEGEIPISGARVEFHINNPAIAYLEPVNTTTDENGTVIVRLYSAAPKDATPEELINYMGSVTIWATYHNMTTNSYAVSFGGIGSISGDVVDPNNNLLIGAKVELWTNESGEWVIAKDYTGNELTTMTDGHGHYSFNVPAAPQGTAYRVVAYYGDGTGYADIIVYPFKTSTADVVVTTYEAVNITGLGAFLLDAQGRDVKFVTGSNILSAVDYYAKDFLVEYIGAKPVYTDESINVEALSSNDMLIAIGGPAVNSITAYYQNMTPVKMVTNDDGSISIIVNNETVANWTVPSPWWNVTKGYWVIQRVVDDSGAIIYMIYGTDADSTWAAAYYFSKHFAELQGRDYVVGYWEDTDGQIFGDALKFASDDTNGFSPTDEIGELPIEG